MSINIRSMLEPGCEQLKEQSTENNTVAKYLQLRDTELADTPIVYLYQQMAIELAEENNRLRKSVSLEHGHDNIKMIIELPTEYFTRIIKMGVTP